MNNAFDVANYIIDLAEKTGEPVTNMKLQKLLYYSYAWVLVESNNQQQLFSEPIQAWKYGPVVPPVYELYQDCGADNIKQVSKDHRIEYINDINQKLIVEDVFKIYGTKTALQLVELSHCEPPWRDSYQENVRDIVISRQAIFKYFSSLKTWSTAAI